MSDKLGARQNGSIPVQAGIGLRADHYQSVLDSKPPIGWLEAHSENYFGDGGAPLRYLERIREHYPLSLHGVGLSIGSVDELNRRHLTKIKELIHRFEPGLVSEHLCWASVNGIHSNDLLPLPYTQEALDHVSSRVAQVQDFLGRQILIENVSSYLQFKHSHISEWEFLVETARSSGCGILLDVNNIYVNSVNHRFDAARYLNAIPDRYVQEIHLAGFAVNQYERGEVLIDNHGARVAEPVWTLYERAIQRFGKTPTLIEWDTDIPPLDTLLDEAAKANAVMEEGNRAWAA